MKTRLRTLLFDLAHNCIAHPVMSLSRYHPVAVRFHDWTARFLP